RRGAPQHLRRIQASQAGGRVRRLDLSLPRGRMISVMLDLKRASGLLRRRGAALLVLLLVAVGVALYFEGLRHNPPGFHLDESSIAYNAHTVSQTGRDEHGEAWPLYFRAFGEFKNPVLIY